MRLRAIVPRSLTGLALISLLAFILPAAAQAATATKTDPGLVLRTDVNITDTGFDPPMATVAQGPGCCLFGVVVFKNTGTKVHTATIIPGSPLASQFVNCCVTYSDTKHNKDNVVTNDFNTGGLAPGQSIALAFQADGDYQYTSYNDCLAGDRPPTTTFDCKPADIHVIDYTGSTGLSPSMPGSTLVDQGKRIQDGQKGSGSHPLTGTIKVTIDDLKGYDPAKMTIAAGSTVVWTNKGTKIHDVVGSFSGSPPDLQDGDIALNSGGLAPGQSYSYYFPLPLSSSVKYVSDVANDLIPFPSNGLAGVSGKKQSVFVGKISVTCKPGESNPINFAQTAGIGLPCGAPNTEKTAPSYLPGNTDETA